MEFNTNLMISVEKRENVFGCFVEFFTRGTGEKTE